MPVKMAVNIAVKVYTIGSAIVELVEEELDEYQSVQS
jgi:hypothetical protein